MKPRIECAVSRFFRARRKTEILCRLTYEITQLENGMCRWFLIAIEELE
jgi:hypothetical protein